MSKRWCLVLPVILLLSISGAGYAQDDTAEAVAEFTDHPARVVRNINGLNVRRAPAIEDDNIVGRLQPGQQVHVLAREGDWQQVRSEDGLFGWSHSDYLVDLPPRQLGEKRLFRISNVDTGETTTVNAELNHIGEHNYIYFYSRNQLPSPDFGLISKMFDQNIYSQVLALWNMDTAPSYEGDERVVILMIHGYSKHPGEGSGIYLGRDSLPGDLRPDGHRVGYLGITWSSGIAAGAPTSTHELVLAHEFFHMIQHMADSNESTWLHEALARFNEYYLGYDYLPHHATYFNNVDFPLLLDPTHSSGLVFMYYILERYGLETLQSLFKHPKNGLAALDAVLAEQDHNLDADTLFADWVLANYLYDPTLGDGRYGYTILSSFEPKVRPPDPKAFITETPFQSQLFAEIGCNQYAPYYYDLSSLAYQAIPRLELDLKLSGASSQDAWLQLAQVIDGEVTLQRFRASDFRNRAISATLSEHAERAFLVLSLFDPIRRAANPSANFELSIRVPGAGNEAATERKQNITAIQIVDEAGATELTQAAAAGNFVRVGELLLTQKANPDQPMGLHPEAALRLAAAAGHEDVVALLLLTDVDIHARDSAGNTAQTLAEQAGQTGVLKLLDIGARKLLINRRQSNFITSEEKRALYAAARSGNLTQIERLLADGIHPDIRYEDPKTTPLMLVSQRGFRDLTLRLLLEGASPGLKSHDQYVPLFYAIEYGHSDIAAMLLLSLNPNSMPRTYSKDLTALHLATQYGRPDIVRLLLSSIHRGSRVNEFGNHSGKTALYYAGLYEDGVTKSLETSIAIVKLLLAAGADPTLKDRSGNLSPYESARRNGPYAIFQLYEQALSQSK